ncbi:hypothetical protein [uncultured Sphingomonas sp.]|uniref:hypothetical protein n=1 Tax=uncultured Sphingomonas sp. TaxID=158754 RepID=UPI00263394BA|nr:hypothetical protein [uncultured Sphingomonas sp.]
MIILPVDSLPQQRDMLARVADHLIWRAKGACDLIAHDLTARDFATIETGFPGNRISGFQPCRASAS